MPRTKFKVRDYQYAALQMLKPPEHLSVSKWAERYRMLDTRSSAMPGKWRNDMTPYLTGIMDEFNNYETEEIIFCKPTQCGGTEAMQNIIGYIVMQDPSPTMVVYPTDTLAKSISENRLQPALKATPEINRKFRENDSSLLELQFDGMYLSLSGSNSPSGLSSKPIKYLMMDEVDKYPSASGKEADPIKLAEERVKAFYNSKIYITSTPTIRTGHIWKAKEDADIEKHFFVPCPHCGEYIELKFSNIRFPEEEGMSYADRAEFAVYVCQECGSYIRDGDKPRMLRKGEWRVVRHSTKYVKKVAFWINTLYSPFVRWSEIAKEFLTSKDTPEELQNFVNSWLAEPWEETKLKTSAELVLERQTDVPEYVVPEWAKMLTGGVDVQETCLYWTIRAWGDYMTSQNIAHGQAINFTEVDRIMNTEYRKETGEPLIVNLCLIDSGDQTDLVYDFYVDHTDYVMPAKGASHDLVANNYKLSKIKMNTSRAYGLALVFVDTDKYKDMIAGRMQRANGEKSGSWMVYMGCDYDYASQVTAEQKVVFKKDGKIKSTWKPKHTHIDNHYLDTEVYAMAAGEMMGARTLHLQGEEKTEQPGRQQKEPPPTPEEKWINVNEDWLGGNG